MDGVPGLRPCPKAIRKKYYSWRIGGDRTRFFGDPRGDRGLVAVVTDRRRPLLTDEFTSVLGRYELYGGRVWRFGSGECKFQVTQARGVRGRQHRRTAATRRIEAEFLLERREVPGYVLAGVTLFADTENHWRLLLVQRTDGHRYFEMVERYRGVHQAQTVPGQIRTRLEGRHEGNLGQWDYGRRYRLAISLTSDSIAGEVRGGGS